MRKEFAARGGKVVVGNVGKKGCVAPRAFQPFLRNQRKLRRPSRKRPLSADLLNCIQRDKSPRATSSAASRCPLTMLAGLSPMAYTPSPMVVRAPTRAVAPVMETLDDLKALAPKLNPVVGYYNP
jgi:hypothetical protein